MAISSIYSYLTTADLFLAHWNTVNDVLGDVTLPSGVNRGILADNRSALDDAMVQIVAQNVAYQTAIGTRDNARAPLLLILSQFNVTMRARFPGNSILRALSRVPGGNPSPGVALSALRTAMDVWVQANGFSPAVAPPFVAPLTLPQKGGINTYTLAMFATAVAAYDSAAQAVETALNNLTVYRQQRDDLLPIIKSVMVDYRRTLPGLLPPGDALLDSMPTITAAPGSTPAAVSASVEWVVSEQKARITIIPDDDPPVAVSAYQVRYCTGPGSYKTNEESVVGNFLTGSNTLDTNIGLAAPGAVALFRVYSLTATGNEKGGATLKIVRPANP